MRALSEVRKEQLVGFFSCCVAAQLPRRMESMRLLVALFWVCSNMHTECLCSLMYRLMNTRALLQSKDHSVGSKRYLSRLEKRVESFASPRDEAWLPGWVWNATPNPCRLWRGTLSPGYKPRWGLVCPSVNGAQSPALPGNSNGRLDFLGQHKRKPEFPVVTRESRRTLRKTTWFPRHPKMRPLPSTACQEKPQVRIEVQNGTWHPWSDPKSFPTHRSHSRGTPRFPARLQLSPFTPPDRDKMVDSPALSGRGSRSSWRTSGWHQSNEEIRDVSLPVTPRPSARATAYFTQKFQVDGCLVALLSSPCRWSPHTVFPLKSGGQQSSAEREQAHCSSWNSLFLLTLCSLGSF